MHLPPYVFKMLLADIVSYGSVLAWSWVMGWGYVFAGVGAYAVIYFNSVARRLIGMNKFLKELDEEFYDN